MPRRHALEILVSVYLLSGPVAACNNHAASKTKTAAPSGQTAVDSGSSGGNNSNNAAGTTATVNTPNPAVPTVAKGYGFLAAADIAVPPDITPATTAEATTQITGWDALAGEEAPAPAPAPAPGDGGGSSGDCFTAALAATPIKGTDTAITIDYKGDLADCQTKASATGPYAQKYTSFEVHFLQIISCAQGGLSKAIGKTQGQLSSVDFGCSTGVATEISELQLLAKSTFASSGTSGPAVSGNSTLSIVSYHAMADLSPCTKTLAGGVQTLKSGCIDADKVVTTTTLGTTPPIATTTYKKATGSEIVKSTDGAAVWPTAGTLQLALANWTGTLVYAGPKTAPTYNLKDASGAVIKGVLPTPGMSLIDTAGRAALIARGISQMEAK